MSDPSELPLLERIQRYLDQADDARREAERTKGTLCDSYLLIAEHWERLADDAAKRLNAGAAASGRTKPFHPPPPRWNGEWLRLVK